jgi:hypothetical protein
MMIAREEISHLTKRKIRHLSNAEILRKTDALAEDLWYNTVGKLKGVRHGRCVQP